MKDELKYKAHFSLENEISKVKILVPFSELIKNNEYRKQILKMFKSDQISSDILNLKDDYPTVLFGPKVKFLGLIKDLVITLTQLLAKILVMDVIVVDILVKFGMLLSRSWSTKLKKTLQMDLSFATIPIFGEQRKLYREVKLAYMVNSKDTPENYPIHFVEIELGSSVFYNDSQSQEENKK